MADSTYINNIRKCFNDIELKTHEKQKTDYEHKQAKNQFPKIKGRKHRSRQTCKNNEHIMHEI